MLIQPIPITPTFTSTAFTSTTFTPTTSIGSPTALIAIARTSRDGDWYRHRYGDRYWDRDMDRDVVVPQPIELPRLLVFGDGMEVDDVVDDDAGGDDGDGDVDCDVDVDEDSDSDSESTTSSTTSTSSITSTTSHISDISSMTSVSSSSSIAKSSTAAGVVYVPPHKLSTTKSESEFDSGGSIPSHRLLSRSRFQHSAKSYPNPNSQSKSQSQSTSQSTSQSKSQSKSSVSVCRYKYQGGETGVMTGGVMLGSTTRSPFTPTPTLTSTRSRPPLTSTRTRSPLARPTKRGIARTLILGPDSSSSLDWRRPRLRVPGVPVA